MTEPCTKCMALQQQVDWFNKHVVAIIDTEDNSIRNLGDAEEDIRILKLELQELRGLLKNVESKRRTTDAVSRDSECTGVATQAESHVGKHGDS